MKKFILIFFVVVIVVILFVLNFSQKYNDINKGIKVTKVREVWGNPSYIGDNDSLNFIDVYKTSFNKYVFIYNKNDSLLVEKWKEN